MRHFNHHRPRAHTTTDNQPSRRTPRAERRTSQQARIQLVANAIQAGYIHDISQRHREVAPPV